MQTIVAAGTWENKDALVGQEFVSDWIQIDEARIQQFEQASFANELPHALNEELYPQGLIEGFHLLSVLDYLVNTVSYIQDPDWSGWNYGLDKVRFVSPVSTSDAIRVRGAIESISPRGDGVVVLYKCTLEVHGRDKPGMVAEWKVLWSLVDES